MAKKDKIWIYGIVGFSLLFIASAVIFQIFEFEILPYQFYGALIGVVITAIITLFLLRGQTANEETKEKNVKVFEEKTLRYNNFIEEIWKIWEDRIVTLDEINEITKLFCKDIILFTSSENTQKIIEQLNNIAEHSSKQEIAEEDKNLIQSAIYDIIDILAKDLQLGGNISHETRKELFKLESKINKLIELKERKEYVEILQQEYIDFICKNIEERLNIEKVELNFIVPDHKEDVYLWFKIKDSDIWLVVGPHFRGKHSTEQPFIGFWSYYYNHSNYHEYRYKLRGTWKDLFANYQKTQNAVVFSDSESVNSYIESLKSNTDKNTKHELLVEEIIEFYEKWNVDGITIKEILKKS